jgi:hypothetical protein
MTDHNVTSETAPQALEAPRTYDSKNAADLAAARAELAALREQPCGARALSAGTDQGISRGEAG